MNGEVMTFDLTGYTCAKEGDVSIVFRNILTRFDIAGVPQTEKYGDRDQFWGNEAYVSVKCVAETEMIQIDPPSLILQAGTSPLGALEKQRAEEAAANELIPVR